MGDRSRNRLVIALALSGTLASAHCAHGPETVASATPWTVRIGSQGGFTGGSSGHLIHSDGTVQSWSQITPSDTMSIRSVGHADSKRLHALQEAMTTAELMALQQKAAGNLTAFLDWSQGAESRHYTWAEQVGEVRLPEPLQRAYVAALAAVTSASR